MPVENPINPFDDFFGFKRACQLIKVMLSAKTYGRRKRLKEADNAVVHHGAQTILLYVMV